MKCKICNYEHDTETCLLSDNVKIVVNESDLVGLRNHLSSAQIPADDKLFMEMNKFFKNMQYEVENIIMNSRRLGD